MSDPRMSRSGEMFQPASIPRRRRLVEIDGQSLAVIESNADAAGPPIIFLHGITANVDLWEPSLPPLVRDQRRWISLSLPGHAPSRINDHSPTFWKQVTPARWAQWYDAVLQQLIGDEPAEFVGWSTGGFTALALASFAPQRVRGILSISGFAVGKWLGLIGLFQRLSLSMLTRWGVRSGFGTVGRSRWLFERVIRSGVGGQRAFRESSVRVPTMQDWFVAFGQHDPAVMAELFQKIAEFDLSENIGRIACPTLIVGGESDPYIPLAHTRWIADQVAGATLTTWPGAGHMFFAERTREYQELLVRWLQR